MQTAQSTQHAAAHDPRPYVRVVAGPGTGKSATIEERIRWLLDQGTPAASIFVVSFTRASALDLRQRIHSYCSQNGQPTSVTVRVSTLHSLALLTLRAAGLLTHYPADPLVMDGWELEHVFDAEFGHVTGIAKRRRELIRLEREAVWSTGMTNPANYVPPSPAITVAEQNQFDAFHSPRTQAYSCVLPGEIVKLCVEKMASGTLNAVNLLHISHVVVDEFQDLNPMDLEFVHSLAAQGAQLFVAGDDDQSIYSFRFASPIGIQDFAAKYNNCGLHTLDSCFRCTPSVLTAAQSLIAVYAQPNRIAKNLSSLYLRAVPPSAGVVHRWKFSSGVSEARAVAESCRDIIANGLNPRDILVLLSNQRSLFPALRDEFLRLGVPIEPPRTEGFLESNVGRFVLAALRIVCNTDDYVAHRVVLGSLPNIGISTCNDIAESVIANNINYRTVFYLPLPNGVFSSRLTSALGRAQAVCSQIGTWNPTDTVGHLRAGITALLASIFPSKDLQAWDAFANSLPSDMTIQETRDYLWTDSDEQQETLLTAAMARLNLPVPPTGVLPPRVRVMTMHGAKGLSAKVVFVPGLEDELLPGPWRKPYSGLVLEAARLLYVSITRARAACILSYAETRMVNGAFSGQTASRFTTHLAGRFAQRTAGLDAVETGQILGEISSL